MKSPISAHLAADAADPLPFPFPSHDSAEKSLFRRFEGHSEARLHAETRSYDYEPYHPIRTLPQPQRQFR